MECPLFIKIYARFLSVQFQLLSGPKDSYGVKIETGSKLGSTFAAKITN